MGVFFPNLINLVIMALVLTVSIREIYRAVVIPKAERAGSHCGQCGQLLATVESGRCPECGARHLDVGVLTAHAALRYRGTMLGLVVGWTCTFLILAVPVGVGISFLALSLGGPGPAQQHYTHNVTYHIGPLGNPGPYQLEIDVDITHDLGQPVTGGSLTFTMQDGSSPTATLEYDVDQSRGEIQDARGNVVGSMVNFDLADAELFLDTAQMTDEDRPQDLAATLVQLHKDAIAQPESFESTSYVDNGVVLTSSGTSRVQLNALRSIMPGIVLAFAAIGISGMLYTIGLIFLIRRRQILLATHAPPPPPTPEADA